MLVYRLEDRHGDGIFTSAVWAACKAVAISKGEEYFHDVNEPDPRRHPTPQTDVPGWGDLPDKLSFYCCFETIEQLLVWFDSEAVRVQLNVLGAKLKVYDTSEHTLMRGTYQCMFRKREARLVSERPVPTAS